MVLAVCLVCMLDWIMVNARIDNDNDGDNSSMYVGSSVDSSSSVGGGGSETGS